jgi:hypothetical protein
MMMVVTVMAVALHLIQTLRENPGAMSNVLLRMGASRPRLRSQPGAPVPDGGSDGAGCRSRSSNSTDGTRCGCAIRKRSDARVT